MTAIELHPEFLSTNGKRQFAVLSYEEYEALQQWMEDAQDLFALEDAIKENRDEPSFTLEQVKTELNNLWQF